MIFRSSDGTLIFCESFCSPKARASLLVVHGLGEHSGRYDEFIKECRKLRLDVHCMDLRGHGRSQGIRGHFSSMEELHADIDEWISHLVSSNEIQVAIPLFIFGHSLGGLITATYVSKYVAKPLYPALSGMILSSPALGLHPSLLRIFEKYLAKNLPAFLRTMQVPSGIVPEQISHDSEEIEKYRNDPLVHGWITPAAYLSIERAIDDLPKLLPSLNLPTLFLISGKDEVVDPEASQAFAERLLVAHAGKVEIKKFHSFFHEAFHETKRDRAYLELKKWVLRNLPKGQILQRPK